MSIGSFFKTVSHFLNLYSQCAAMVMAVVVSSASAGKGKRINYIFIKRKEFQLIAIIVLI